MLKKEKNGQKNIPDTLKFFILFTCSIVPLFRPGNFVVTLPTCAAEIDLSAAVHESLHEFQRNLL